MSKTLLDCVNEVLKKKSIIAGDSALLTSLTDSARQVSIDLAIQCVNEGIDEIYSISRTPMPTQFKESTITLLTSTRAYTLPTDLVRIHWPLVDETNTQFIWHYPGGYEGLLLLDPQQDDTGLPRYGVISPTDGKLFVDRAPTSVENGKVYQLRYDKDPGLSGATDNVPFNNTVFRAMVPVWAQLWDRERRSEAFDAVVFKASLGRTCRLLTEELPRESYNPRQVRNRNPLPFPGL